MLIANTIKEKVDEYKREIGIGNYVDTFQNLFKESQDIPGNAIFPGHIFSFEYQLNFPVRPEMLPYSDSILESMLKEGRTPISKKPYFDFNPHGMCLGRNRKGDVLMLNFRVIPPRYRYMILETYWNSYKNVINAAHEVVDEQVKPIPYLDRRRNAAQMGPFHTVNPQKMNQVGINIDFAINKYETRFISRVKIIDWDQIQKLPFGNVQPADPTMVIAAGLSNFGEIYERFEAKI